MIVAWNFVVLTSIQGYLQKYYGCLVNNILYNNKTKIFLRKFHREKECKSCLVRGYNDWSQRQQEKWEGLRVEEDRLGLV